MTQMQVASDPAHGVLDEHAIYLAPSGRRCRWVPGDENAPRGVPHSRAKFAYDRPDGTPSRELMADGFWLSRENWRLLRRLR